MHIRDPRDKTILVRDKVVVKQSKTRTRPPWDPNPYVVKKLHGTKFHLIREGKTMIQNVEKCKLVKMS